MDFGKMKDGLKDQMSEKVQEGLTKKLDEVTTDVKARFGDFGGQPGEKAKSPSTSAEPTVNASEAEPGTPAEGESEVDETGRSNDNRNGRPLLQGSRGTAVDTTRPASRNGTAARNRRDSQA
jgi:hypothetical protein